MELPPKTLLQGGKYKIIEKIGQGGFGIAYSAIHQGLQTEVCIKEFFYSDLCERSKNSSDITIISKSVEKIKLVDSLQKKFTKEAQRLAKFQHPNIVQVTDNFNENNTAYYVMEFLEGGSLDDLLKRNGAMSEQKAKALILPILDAMDAIHKEDLLHLDIKPANIMLRKNQSPVLIDFGISKYLETANGNTTTAPIGISKGFAPLEQYGGSISDFSRATDIYSLCATIYTMVTGQTPPEPLQMLTNGFKSPRDMRPQLSVDFNAAILKGLATKALDRQQSISLLVKEFGEYEKVERKFEETETIYLEPILTTEYEFFSRAQIKRKNKEFESAINDYSEAIKKNKIIANYYFFRGICYQELNNFKSAIIDYSKVIDITPNNDFAYNKRGLCYNSIGKYIDATNDFFQAYDIKTDNSYLLHWLEMIRKTQNLLSISKYLTNEKFEKRDEVFFTRGEIYLKKGDILKACNDFIQAYKLSDDKSFLDNWIRSNNIEMLNIYLESDLPNKDKVLFEKGKLQITLGERNNGIKNLKEAQKLGNKDANELLNNHSLWERLMNL